MFPTLVCAVVILAAPESPRPVRGHPPAAPQMLIALGVNDKEELVIRDYEIVIVNATDAQAAPIGAHIPRERAVSLDGVKVVTAAGNEVDHKALRERLKMEQAVFAMSWGRSPLDVYRAAMKPESLILVFPKEAPRPESLK